MMPDRSRDAAAWLPTTASPKAAPIITLLPVADTRPLNVGSDSAPCGASAAARSTRPAPKVVSCPGAPRSFAVSMRICTTWAPLRLGNLSSSSAAAPATIGAENDVPLTTTVLNPSPVVRTFTPGART